MSECVMRRSALRGSRILGCVNLVSGQDAGPVGSGSHV